jgi:glycosyltransferase involved in cell wall biosynthesis
MDYRLQLMTLRMNHHAAASGYHRLADVLPGERIIGRPPHTLLHRSLMKALSPAIKRSGSRWYNRVSLDGELIAARRWLTSRRTLFHILYGENCYRYLGRLKAAAPRGNWLVATYHTPPWRLRQLIQDTDHLKRLDAAVAVSTSQLECLTELIGGDRAYFVPHGIDTGFFTPALSGAAEDGRRGGFRFICVGHHLRDYATLAGAAEVLWQEDPEIEILVVVDPSRLGALAGLPNVCNRFNVGDAELRHLYQTSDALILPLRDATANNTLLEGMACGLPVISTDIQGVRDYVGGARAVLVTAGDAEALAAAALRARNRELDLPAMGAASRRTAERLSWPRVARVMQDIYAKVTGATACGTGATQSETS